MKVTRRSFLTSAAISALAVTVDAKTGMPMRKLGRTGQMVSLLGFGAGSRWLMYKDPEKGIAALELALKAGVNYVDSAASYGNGESESWIGRMLQTRKKDFFLVTKITPRKADEAKRTIEASLKRLNVSQVDLMHIHSLGDEQDLAEIEAADGILRVMYQMREQKVARFIGVTCHTNPQVLKTALERHDFDSTQMALNIAQIGNAEPSNRIGQGMTGVNGFEAVAMPVAVNKGMGLTAMKIFGQEKLIGRADIPTMLRYSMSLPVASTVVGMPKVEFIEQNLAVARSFRPLPKEEMKRLPGTIPPETRAALEAFFSGHIDA